LTALHEIFGERTECDSNSDRAAAKVPDQEHGSVESRIIDPVLDPGWDRAVVSHPQSNLFHRAAWARVLCKTYGHKPVCLQFYRGSELVALVPFMEVISPFIGRRGVSVPFSDLCEPLVFGEWRQESLMAKLLELGRARNWRYFEVRGGKGTLPGSAVSGEKYYGHKLDLSVGVDKLFDGFHGSVRRAIRKAEKSRLTIEVTSSRKAMLDFYRLHVRTRRRHGLPPQPLPFFLSIDEEIMKTDLGFVTLVKNRTSPIAAAVFFCSGKAALFKFGASDERSHEFRGNNLVMWEAIKRLCEKGLKTLHFGRTAMTDEGLRRFKLSWGTEEGTIEYFRFALRAQAWDDNRRDGSGFHNQLFRKLPLAINRLAGTLIYPHLD
jgi:Acetyltransferase (GNAT) domain